MITNDPVNSFFSDESSQAPGAPQIDPVQAFFAEDNKPAPSPMMAQASVPTESDNLPLSEKIVNAINFMGDTPQAFHAAQVGVVEGGIDTLKDFYLALRDVGDHFGITDKKVTAKTRQDFTSEKEQYKNLPSVQGYPTTASVSNLLTKGILESAPFAKGAQAAGLVGSTLARGIAGGALVGAGSAAVQDPGQVANPLTQRLAVQAPIGAAIGGGISAAGGAIRNAMGGAYSTENALAQTTRDAVAKSKGVQLPVPQITQQATAESLQKGLSNLPMVGTAGSLRKLQSGVANAQNDFMESLAQPFDKSKDLYARVIQAVDKKALEGLGSAAQGTTPKISISNAASAAQDIAQKSKYIGLDTEGPIAKWTKTLSNSRVSMQGGMDLLNELDDAVSTAKSASKFGNGPKGDYSKLSAMRSALAADLQAAAEKAGAGTDFAWAKQVSKQEKAYKQVKDIFEKAAVGGLNPAKFGAKLMKESENLEGLLTPDLKHSLKGLNTLYNTAYKALNIKAQPNSNITAGIIGGGIASATNPVVGAGVASSAALVKLASSMLDSQLGRNLLTHLGRLSPGSAKAGDMAKRIIQGMMSSQASNVLTDNTGQ